MLPGDSPELFVRRKQIIISTAIPWSKRWSVVWASRLDAWEKHIVRNTNGCVWTARIAGFRNADELEARRRANPSRRLEARVVSGFTAVRWYESIATARAYLGID